MTIYYIHGFGSCAAASEPKRKDLEEIFPNEKCICLDYDSSKSLNEIYRDLQYQLSYLDRDEFFIGTSLGGLIAYYMTITSKSALSVALFNPLTNGDRMLNLVGENFNYCTEESFIFSEEAARSYERFKIEKCNIGMSVFLAKDDKVIDPEQTRNELSSFAQITDFCGGHRVESFLPFKEELIKVRNHIAF